MTGRADVRLLAFFGATGATAWVCSGPRNGPVLPFAKGDESAGRVVW